MHFIGILKCSVFLLLICPFNHECRCPEAVRIGFQEISLQGEGCSDVRSAVEGRGPGLDFRRQLLVRFLLVKTQTGFLETETSKLTCEQFVAATGNLNRLFEESLNNLECRDRPIRIVYALQTLCGLIKAVFRKSSTETPSPSPASTPTNPTPQNMTPGPVMTTNLDIIINCLVGIESAEHRMQELIGHLNSFLVGDHPSSLKELCLNLLLIICTGVDNVSRNTLVEYIMINSVFESLIHLLSHSESRSLHGHTCILILTLLVQYRKYESANPYVVKLSILDQEMSLHGYSNVITNTLATYTGSYEANMDDQPSSGWFSSITSMVGNMFVSDEIQQVRVEQMRARNAVLLALYEAVHLNRNFIATLAHYQTEPSKPQSEPNENVEPNEEKVETETTPSEVLAPSNLLVTFLSIVLSSCKTPRRIRLKIQ